MSTTVEHTKACMGFDSRVMLDAIQGLEKSRSASFLTSIVRRKDEIERSKLKTVWDIKPIDFSVKLYQPRPLPRNSRESMIKDRKSSAVIIEERSERKRTIDPSVPKLHLPSLLMVKEEDSRPIFHRKCRPPSPQTAEIHFIREGKFKPDQYVTQSVSIHKRDMFRQVFISFSISHSKFSCFSSSTRDYWCPVNESQYRTKGTIAISILICTWLKNNLGQIACKLQPSEQVEWIQLQDICCCIPKNIFCWMAAIQTIHCESLIFLWWQIVTYIYNCFFYLRIINRLKLYHTDILLETALQYSFFKLFFSQDSQGPQERGTRNTCKPGPKLQTLKSKKHKFSPVTFDFV